MKIIYICGPVSNRTWEKASEHFKKAEQRIRYLTKNKLDIVIRNPMQFCSRGIDWHQAMRSCIRELSHCDGIALLQGWEFSKGAKIELWLAKQLNIPVVYIEPPAGPMDLTEVFIVSPETLRYFNARLKQFYQEYTEKPIAEQLAALETANRYLDPYGFEYIEIQEGK